jgi:hypothetical protein
MDPSLQTRRSWGDGNLGFAARHETVGILKSPVIGEVVEASRLLMLQQRLLTLLRGAAAAAAAVLFFP